MSIMVKPTSYPPAITVVISIGLCLQVLRSSEAQKLRSSEALNCIASNGQCWSYLLGAVGGGDCRSSLTIGLCL